MKKKSKMTFTGVDGCRSGWLLAAISSSSFNWQLYATLPELYTNHSHSEIIYIDIPLGLSDRNIKREIDSIARTMLKPYKSSSIFTPPCRQAVYAENYSEAKALNLKEKGKSISIQSWYICPKIKEADELITPIGKNHPFREAHPELCFAMLNGGTPLVSKKSTREGISERLILLNKFYGKAEEFYNEILKNTQRNKVKPDDIVDAICLAVSAMAEQKEGMKSITGQDLYDSNGILMALYYPNLPAHR
jgi:predicted RNase H-like nuclease